MTVNEFSDGFDVLYNNVMSNQAPGLDEYEKSFFLTKAQDEILKNYFNPKGNKYQEGIDSNPKRQIDFSMVLKVDTCTQISENSDIDYTPLDDASLLYKLPDDIFIILNERMKSDNRPILVIPINHSEYDKYSMKPYPYPTKNSTWRILGYGTNKDDDKVFVGEIIKAPCTGSISSYTIRYVKQPRPIILGDLGGASIGGKSKVSECELDPILHQEILQRAVELAKSAYVGDLNSTIEMGKRSE